MSEYGYINKWFDKADKFYNISLKQFEFHKKILGTRVRVTRIKDTSKYKAVLGSVYTSNILNDADKVEFDYVVIINLNSMKQLFNRNIDSLEFYDRFVPESMEVTPRFMMFEVAEATTVSCKHDLGYYPEISIVDKHSKLRSIPVIDYVNTSIVNVMFSEEFSGVISIDPYPKKFQRQAWYGTVSVGEEVIVDIESPYFEIVVFDITDSTVVFPAIRLIDDKHIGVTFSDNHSYRIFITQDPDEEIITVYNTEGHTIQHDLGGSPIYRVWDLNGSYGDMQSGVAVYEPFINNSRIDFSSGQLRVDYRATGMEKPIQTSVLELGDVLTYSRNGMEFRFKITNIETYGEANHVVYKYTIAGFHELKIN